MAVTITINGNSSYITYIDVPTLTIEETIPSAGDSCSFDFKWPITGAAVTKPLPGHIVVITVDSTKEFEGPIISMEEKFGAPAGYILYAVKCVDYTRPFSRKLVVGKRSKELASTRITWVLQNFCDSAFSADLTGIDTGATTDINVDERTYDYELVSSVLDELAEATYHNWYVDFEKKLHFYISETKTTPLNASYENILDVDTNTDVFDMNIQEDVSQLRNWIIIKGHKVKAGSPLTQDWKSDGTQSFFSLFQEPYDFNTTDVKAYVATVAGQGTPGFSASDPTTPGWTQYTAVEDPLQTQDGAITGQANTLYFCSHPDTLVTTSRGLMPIGTILPGNYVLTHTGSYRRVLKVIRRSYTGQWHCVEHEGSNRPLYVTANHRLLSHEWCEVASITEGDLVVVTMPSSYLAMTRVIKNESSFVIQQPVVSLEVEEDHSYITEGIVSQNCVLNIGCRFGTSFIPENNSLIKVQYYPVEGQGGEKVQIFIDRESIRMMANREGSWSSGIYQHVENLTHVRVDNENAITAIGTLLLERYAWPQITGRMSSYLNGWHSGQFFWIVSGTVDDAKIITTAGQRDLYDQEVFWKNNKKQAIKCYVQGVTKSIVDAVPGGNTVMRTDITFSNVPFEVKGL